MSDSEANTPDSLSEPEDLSQKGSPKREDEDEDDLGDDLFGGEDGDDEDVAPKYVSLHSFDPSMKLTSRTRRSRHLDDEELDSGDDQGRTDRAGSEARSQGSVSEERLEVAPVDFPRHAIPESSEGEVCAV